MVGTRQGLTEEAEAALGIKGQRWIEMWSWEEKVTPGGSNRVGGSATEERTGQVRSGNTAQLSWLEPRVVEGNKGNQAVWEKLWSHCENMNARLSFIWQIQPT